MADNQVNQPGSEAKPDDHDRKVTVTVNEQPVHLEGKAATGAQIKAAAIAQGVSMQPNFVLQEELPDGTGRDIGDGDVVELRSRMRFTAFPPNDHKVTVTVNEQPVHLEGKTATGTQIKAAAIAQGVLIQPNFVLQEELPNGTSRIIGDSDVVHLRAHLRFTAIAPDDNS
jgi:acyl dehydratase